MKVAILGAGYTGLSAAYQLTKKGINTTLIESENQIGGLASGFRLPGWKWYLDRHYHHWFSNDQEVINLADELNHKIIARSPKTSIFINGGMYQLDTPISLLKFPYLDMPDKIRSGLVLAYLKLINNPKKLESKSAKDYLIRLMGKNSWKTLWEPLFIGKFGEYSSDIAASWFWARIKKRTKTLLYPQSGYEKFSDHLLSEIKNAGGALMLGYAVNKVVKKGSKFHLTLTNKKTHVFDVVISTIPTTIFTKIIQGLPQDYLKKIKSLKGLAAQSLVLVLDKPFFSDNTYWLSINDPKFPFLALVEHTNFIDKKYYGGNNILYIGDYLKLADKKYICSTKDLLKMYAPHLKQINPNFKKTDILSVHRFKNNFAQPIITTNYHDFIPEAITPIGNLFMANMQQVYPWDRGTNYAIQLGKQVSDLVLKYNKL